MVKIRFHYLANHDPYILPQVEYVDTLFKNFKWHG
jgi:hypothetical protein